MFLLVIRFAAEIAGLVALGFVGATVPSAPVLRIALGVGLPLALAVIWARVAAPKAHNPLPQRARQLVGTALLVAVGVILALAGQTGWGIGLAAIVLADQALLLALGLDDAAAAFGPVASEGAR